MKHRSFKAIRAALLVLCLGLTGCFIGDGVAERVSGPDLDVEKVAWIVRDKTLESEVIATFGPPTFIVPTSQGKMIVYREVWQRISISGLIFTEKYITTYDRFLFVEITDGKAVSYTLSKF